jgi:hypothetical protein
MKLVSSSFRASSSIQNGWIRRPTKSSANCSSELAKPVQVLPSTRRLPSERRAVNRTAVAWQMTAVTLPAS